MNPLPDYNEINRQLWNSRTDAHLASDFYNLAGFLQGHSSLNGIELELLGDVAGKSILHLQCHFGQDSISLARMGAQVTGADLSDNAIHQASELAAKAGADARFVCCDIYDLPLHLDEQFDIVFTSYGTIGWLPDLEKWAGVVSHFLKPGGRFVFVEFHPVVWMFDGEFRTVAYRYFNSGPIVETESGTYADRDADIQQQSVGWNHSISEVVNNLIGQGLIIRSLDEFDYSPYNVFSGGVEEEPKKFRVAHLGDKIPMVYSVVAEKL